MKLSFLALLLVMVVSVMALPTFNKESASPSFLVPGVAEVTNADNTASQQCYSFRQCNKPCYACMVCDDPSSQGYGYCCRYSPGMCRNKKADFEFTESPNIVKDSNRVVRDVSSHSEHLSDSIASVSS